MNQFRQELCVQGASVLTVICLCPEPVLVDRCDDGNSEEKRVEIGQGPRIAHHADHGKDKPDDRDDGKGRPQGPDQEVRDETEKQSSGNDVPEPDEGWNVNSAAGEEVYVSERGGAGHDGKPLAHETQVLALVGKRSAFGKLLAARCDMGKFAGFDLPFDGGVEILRRTREPIGRTQPSAENLAPTILESEQEIEELAQSLALFWLVTRPAHSDIPAAIMAPASPPVNAKTGLVGAGERERMKIGFRKWLQVLRPLAWWVILVLVLYAIRLHERWVEETRIIFGVQVEGQFPISAETQLDGRPVVSGQRISLGEHTFTATAAKNEAFRTNFFAWYGPHSLGDINLKRLKGSLQVQASPSAQTVIVTGPEFSTKLFDCSNSILMVPTDAYVVKAQYGHWSHVQSAIVAANQTANVQFAPRLGALHLTSNEEKATYGVQFADGQAVANGEIPATVSGLPAGSYAVKVTYREYQFETNVLIVPNATNEITAGFDLGTARIDSNPSGASVYAIDGNFLGQTPLELPDLQPGTLRFHLALTGFERANGMLEIAGSTTNAYQTNLLDSRYVSAMRGARQYQAESNYSAMLRAANAALDIKPDDEAALSLRSTAQNQVDAASAQQKAEEERVERLKRPREMFDALCATNPAASLFAEHELKTSKSAKQVEQAIIGALQSEPDAFEVISETSPIADVYQVIVKREMSLGILGGSQRVCLLTVGQTKDDETEILFKVLEFQIRHNVVADGVTMHDEKKLIPVSPELANGNGLQQMQLQSGIQMVESKVKRGIERIP